MYDAGKIVFGMLIFVAVMAFPFVYTNASGKAGEVPDPKPPAGEKSCVEDKAYMTAWHMDMIDTWRDAVVRDANRIYTASDGTEHNMSLSENCMKCHTDKQAFCDSCHDYVGVTPYCWDCHVEPKGE